MGVRQQYPPVNETDPIVSQNHLGACRTTQCGGSVQKEGDVGDFWIALGRGRDFDSKVPACELRASVFSGSR